MKQSKLKETQLRMERRKQRRKRANELRKRGIVSTGSISLSKKDDRPALIIRFQ
jgi:hypothetical protein